MKIVILSCAWKRPDILRAFCIGVKRLMAYKAQYQIDCLVVVSEKKSAAICKEYGIKTTYHPNKPVGKKWNHGITKLRKKDFDYVLIMGSDDIVSNGVLDFYHDCYKKKIAYAGFLDFYAYNQQTDKLVYYPGMGAHRTGEPIGAGRLLHKNLVKYLDYELWYGNLNKSLDYSMTLRMQDLELSHCIVRLKDIGQMLIDVKTETNITSFKSIAENGNQVRCVDMNRHFPKTELKQIRINRKTKTL